MTHFDPFALEWPLRTGDTWQLSERLYRQLQVFYPDVNTDLEIGKAHDWCRKVCRSRRKTARGMGRFLRSWFDRARRVE